MNERAYWNTLKLNLVLFYGKHATFLTVASPIGGASVKSPTTTQDICAMKGVSQASYMNSVSSQVDPFDRDVENVDYVAVIDRSRKYEDCHNWRLQPRTYDSEI